MKTPLALFSAELWRAFPQVPLLLRDLGVLEITGVHLLPDRSFDIRYGIGCLGYMTPNLNLSYHGVFKKSG